MNDDMNYNVNSDMNEEDESKMFVDQLDQEINVFALQTFNEDKKDMLSSEEIEKLSREQNISIEAINTLLDNVCKNINNITQVNKITVTKSDIISQLYWLNQKIVYSTNEK